MSGGLELAELNFEWVFVVCCLYPNLPSSQVYKLTPLPPSVSSRGSNQLRILEHTNINEMYKKNL